MDRLSDIYSTEYSMDSLFLKNNPWSFTDDHAESLNCTRPRGAAHSGMSSQSFGGLLSRENYQSITNLDCHQKPEMEPKLYSILEDTTNYGIRNHPQMTMSTHSEKEFLPSALDKEISQAYFKEGSQLGVPNTKPTFFNQHGSELHQIPESSSFWGSSEIERPQEQSRIYYNANEREDIKIKRNTWTDDRKISCSTSISDDELEKIYESYNRFLTEKTTAIAKEWSSLNRIKNEYKTPEKHKNEKEFNQRGYRVPAKPKKQMAVNPRELWANENQCHEKSFKGKTPKGDGCRFCLSNGEMAEFCYTHKLKDMHGRVTCPILSKYTCPICNATGTEAHTRRHCPFYEPMTSSMFKKGCISRRNAAGHIITSRVRV